MLEKSATLLATLSTYSGKCGLELGARAIRVEFQECFVTGLAASIPTCSALLPVARCYRLTAHDVTPGKRAHYVPLCGMRKPRANKHPAEQHVIKHTQREPQAGGSAEIDTRPRVHVLGLPHTIVSEGFSHCAYTGKVLRLPLVLPGYHVIEYSNGISASAAAEHVQIFSTDQLTGFAGGTLASLQEQCTVTLLHDTDLQTAWLALVMRELRKRLRAGDVIAIPYVFKGCEQLVSAFPDCVVVETGIGYSYQPFGAYRVYESETWRAWHFGRYCEGGGLGSHPNYAPATCSAVVPNYYDEVQWALGEARGVTLDEKDVPVTARGNLATPYVFFAGRMASSKGIEIVNALALLFPLLVFVVASGEAFLPDRLSAPNIRFIGRVDSRVELAAWYGGALCTLTPSRFHEPFGGVAVESLLCGTPVLCSDWAAFTETVREGDGLRCNDLYEFNVALKHVVENPEEWQSISSRSQRQDRATARYGLAAVTEKYDAALTMFRRMHAEGLKP